jgi:hypothetical protein
VLTAAGIGEKTVLTGCFVKRKAEEYDALRLEIDACAREISEGSGVGRSECTEAK